MHIKQRCSGTKRTHQSGTILVQYFNATTIGIKHYNFAQLGSQSIKKTEVVMTRPIIYSSVDKFSY